MQPRFLRRLHPGTELIVGVKDLMAAPTDAIVNPANGGLSHGGGLAALISIAAGETMDEDCERIIRKLGRVPKTHAVSTTAGNLPYKSIIHAVGPRMGDGDEREKLKTTIINVMRIAVELNLFSVAFPAISTGIYGVPKKICAKAFLAALDQFWRDESNRKVNLVWLCVMMEDYLVFKDVIGG